MPCIDPAQWGHVAEWLRNGLQNRVHQFNSGRGLHQYNQLLAWTFSEAKTVAFRRWEPAHGRSSAYSPYTGLQAAGAYGALRAIFPKVISGLRRPIAIQAAISFNMNLPE
jgi:hypothetical protein